MIFVKFSCQNFIKVLIFRYFFSLCTKTPENKCLDIITSQAHFPVNELSKKKRVTIWLRGSMWNHELFTFECGRKNNFHQLFPATTKFSNFPPWRTFARKNFLRIRMKWKTISRRRSRCHCWTLYTLLSLYYAANAVDATMRSH